MDYNQSTSSSSASSASSALSASSASSASSSSFASSALNMDIISGKWSIYGEPIRISECNEEKKDNIEIEQVVLGMPVEQPVEQPILSDDNNRARIANIMDQLKDRVLNRLGNNLTYFSNQTALVAELTSMIIAVKAGTIPEAPCYIDMLSSDIFYNIMSFINPREMMRVCRVCNRFNLTSHILIQPALRIFQQGFVAYFATLNMWSLGVVLCVIDTINPDTYEHHTGVHVYLMGSVLYYTNDNLAQYSHIGHLTLAPKTFPPLIEYETDHTPYGNLPHQVCDVHGEYLHNCGEPFAPTAPSTCLLLHPTFRPNLQPEMVGKVIDVDKFQLHDFHLQMALAREDRYGVSFECNGSRHSYTRIGQLLIPVLNRINAGFHQLEDEDGNIVNNDDEE